jgi:uncharacterized phiE125 gp8 family phage protein
VAIASSFKRTTAPGAPFTLADARFQLKNEDESYDDDLVTALSKAAGELAENKTGRAFMQQTWKWIGEDFPCGDRFGFFTLRPGPLVSVSSVKYYPDGGGDQITMVAGTDYEVDTNSTPGRIRFLESLPGVEDQWNAVEIIFVAGYADAQGEEETDAAFLIRQQAALPPQAVAWMKLQLATLYAVRQQIVSGQVTNVQTYTDSLIYPYII